MIVIGYCHRCHRIGPIRVTTPRRGSIQIGLCHDCDKKR